MFKEERIEIRKGSRETIIETFMQDCSLSEFQAEQVWLFLLEHKKILSIKNNELLMSRQGEEEIDESEFILEEPTWYINIRKVTIFFIIFFLNIWEREGISVGTLLMIPQRLKDTFVNLKEEEGSQCLTLEIALHRSKGIKKNEIFDLYNRKECFNNHLTCPYNMEGYCCITKERIEELVKFLEKKELVKEKRRRYFYQV